MKYLAFAEWRITTHRSQDVRQSVRFFRKTRNHTLIWTVVMRGYYLGHPPSVNECISEAACWRETTRKILFDAEARGFLHLDAAGDDSRKKLVYPTKNCVREYEAMVDGYINLAERLASEAAPARRET